MFQSGTSLSYELGIVSYVDLVCYVKLSEVSVELHLATRLVGVTLLCFISIDLVC